MGVGSSAAEVGSKLLLSLVRTSSMAARLTLDGGCPPAAADARMEEADAAARDPLMLREARADCAATMADDAEAC